MSSRRPRCSAGSASPRPSSLWDLAPRGTFEPLLIARGFPRGLASGVGWLPRPPPPWRGVAPAPPSRAVNPFQGLFISFSSVSSRPIKAVWASLCLHAPVQRQGFTGVSRFVPVCRRNGLPCFFGAAIAGARTRRPSRAEQSRQCKHQTVKLDGYTALRPVLRSAGGSVVTAPAVAGAIVRPVCV